MPVVSACDSVRGPVSSGLIKTGIPEKPKLVLYEQEE